MDFFRSQLVAAQASASAFGQQLGNHTSKLAEQATVLSKPLADRATSLTKEASQRFSELHIADSLKNANLPFSKHPESEGPPQEELVQFGITPDFCEFVRSLTYSTFRDFPLPEATTAPVTSEKYLTPWQERHAVLVVQCVKEVNELRYVLSPKRMTDAQFWQIYFALAKKRLPPEAFDPSYVPPPAAQPKAGTAAKLPFGLPADLQYRLRQGISSVSKTLGATAPETAALPSASLKELASRGLHPEQAEQDGSTGTGATSGEPASAAGGRPTGVQTGSPAAAGLTADPDLEEYLRDVMEQQDGDEGREDATEGEVEDEGDDDYEKYLSELNQEDAAEEEPSSGTGAEEGIDKDESDSEDFVGL